MDILMLLPYLLITMCIFFPILFVKYIMCTCKRENKLIEKSIADGHTMTAYLKKTTCLPASMEKGDRYDKYKGKYTYKYNEREYTKTFIFKATRPPDKLTVYFIKNPKDVATEGYLRFSTMHVWRMLLIIFIIICILGLFSRN